MRSPFSSQLLTAASAALVAGQALAATVSPRSSTSTSTSRSSGGNDGGDDDTPLPVLIWHGLGDSFNGEGIQRVADLADAVHPGTLVFSISLAGDDSSGDRSASFFGNVTQQLDTVCGLLAAHPILSTAPAVDAIGFSQGGQFLRGYVERCNAPPVRSLVTFGSQHNGIVEFKACGTTDWLCKGAMALLRFNTWSSFVQNRLVPAQYYRDPSSAESYDTYLDASNFLADINNERLLKNETYKKNIASLENLVLYMFEDDTTVIPRRTAWFDEVNGTDVTPLRERQLYKEDWLGLRELDSRGGIKFRSITGDHMQIPDQVLNDTMAEFFGPARSKATGLFEPDEL
ncbi:palmitoyl protein thioesterase [Purpureocillium lavendulum]|uniref:Palmitoyl-protein thioesterase 1 n=1 Tax=Purpureocillium lavendulum TaxID=1247861 RepID=A0AB34G1Y1_9HYPO|nr:palmitoyl protein thioesterase [Purpureocillium lavendulum]